MNKDNRNYIYEDGIEVNREEFTFYLDLIPEGSKVVDLGCGDGSLLALLRRERKTSGKGIEISRSGVEICRKRELDVIEGRIDERLPYNDKQFDFAICNVTIQMVMYPEILLQEMKRISRYQIISFPNFGFWRSRLDMLFNGRVPKPSMFGYKWYSTGHIHPLSLADLKELAVDIGGLKLEKVLFASRKSPMIKMIQSINPNLFAVLCVCLLSAEE